MRWIGLWFGGCNYASPDPTNPRDLLRFSSLEAARRYLEDRHDNADGRTPCVEDDSELHLYAGEYTENGPDRVLRFGPRGGVIVDRG